MRCVGMLIIFGLDLYKPNHGYVIVFSMRCLYLLVVIVHQSSCMKLRCICIWDTWANHFWVIDKLSLDYFLVAMMGLKCGFILDDVMMWHVWLNHFGVFDQYNFEILLVACWEPMDVMRYFGYWEPMDTYDYQWCLQLPIENYCGHDFLWMLF